MYLFTKQRGIMVACFSVAPTLSIITNFRSSRPTWRDNDLDYTHHAVGFIDVTFGGGGGGGRVMQCSKQR